MPHIHTEPGQHDHTASAYIVRVDGTEPTVFLHMHKKLGRLLQVGGHVELDENPWQAVIHEIAEESGYSLSELELLQPANRITTLPGSTLHPYPVVVETHNITSEHLHSDLGYAFIAHGAPSSSVRDGESTDIRWLMVPQLKALNEPSIYLNTKSVYAFILDVCLNEWERVDPSRYAN